MCVYAGGWGVGPGRTQICPEVQGRALGRRPGVMGDGRRPVAPRPKPFSAMSDAPKCASAHRQVYRYGSVGHARRGLFFGIPQPPRTRNGPPLRYEIDMPTGRSRSCHPNLHLKVRRNYGPCAGTCLMHADIGVRSGWCVRGRQCLSSAGRSIFSV